MLLVAGCDAGCDKGGGPGDRIGGYDRVSPVPYLTLLPRPVIPYTGVLREPFTCEKGIMSVNRFNILYVGILWEPLIFQEQ